MIDLDAIEWREQAATEGPWEWNRREDGKAIRLESATGECVLIPNGFPVNMDTAEAFLDIDAFDRNFIARSRADIPAMLDWIRRAIPMLEVGRSLALEHLGGGNHLGTGWGGNKASVQFDALLAECEGHAPPEEQPQ